MPVIEDREATEQEVSELTQSIGRAILFAQDLEATQKAVLVRFAYEVKYLPGDNEETTNDTVSTRVLDLFGKKARHTMGTLRNEWWDSIQHLAEGADSERLAAVSRINDYFKNLVEKRNVLAHSIRSLSSAPLGRAQWVSEVNNRMGQLESEFSEALEFFSRMVTEPSTKEVTTDTTESAE